MFFVDDCIFHVVWMKGILEDGFEHWRKIGSSLSDFFTIFLTESIFTTLCGCFVYVNCHFLVFPGRGIRMVLEPVSRHGHFHVGVINKTEETPGNDSKEKNHCRHVFCECDKSNYFSLITVYAYLGVFLNVRFFVFWKISINTILCIKICLCPL